MAHARSNFFTIPAVLLLAMVAAAQSTTEQRQSADVGVTSAMRSPFPDDYDEIEPASWRLIKLSMDLSHGGRCDITLLRPLPWIAFAGAEVGGTMDLVMPEMGVSGKAKVLAIEPCPEIEAPSKPGTRPVIGKFVTTNAKVIELSIEGLDEPIGTTASHPFWSLDRNDWVAAGDLKPGEKLRTLDGSAAVKSVVPRPGTETVYNLEVHKDHTFFVSDAKLWVHNNCAKLRPIHPRSTLMSGSNKHSWDFWSGKSTDEIVESLVPRPGYAEGLKVKPDGRVMQGNTRITILMDRGYNVDALPRELIP
jgi:hypothetical protein